MAFSIVLEGKGAIIIRVAMPKPDWMPSIHMYVWVSKPESTCVRGGLETPLEEAFKAILTTTPALRKAMKCSRLEGIASTPGSVPVYIHRDDGKVAWSYIRGRVEGDSLGATYPGTIHAGAKSYDKETRVIITRCVAVRYHQYHQLL